MRRLEPDGPFGRASATTVSESSGVTPQELIVSRPYALGRNSLALVLTNLGTAFSHGILTIVAAQMLAPLDFGRYAIALAASVIAMALADGGVNSIVSRDLGREAIGIRSLMVIALGIRLLFALAVLVAASLVAPHLWTDGETVAAFQLGALIGCVGSISSLTRSAFIGVGRTELEALAQGVERSLLLVLGIVVLAVGQSALLLLGLMLGLRAVALALRSLIIARVALNAPSGGERAHVVPLVREALPLAVAVALGAIYFHVDVLMLGLMVGEDEAGRYQAVVQLIVLVYLIPESLSATLVPAFARTDPTQLGARLAVFLWRALTTGGLATLAIAMAGPAIASILYSELGGLGSIVQVLALASLVRFGSYVLTALMPVIGKGWIRAVGAGAAAAVNITLNLVLIPHHGAVGAAWATVATEAVLFVIYASAVPRRLRPKRWPLGMLVRVGQGLAAVAAAVFMVGLSVPAPLVLAVTLTAWEITSRAIASPSPGSLIFGLLGESRAYAERLPWRAAS